MESKDNNQHNTVETMDIVDDYYKEIQLLLYVILLKNDKIFLHLSRSVSENQILLEATALFDFVRNNPPVRIIENIMIENTFMIDYHVKKHMDCFGIDNVRGGSYSSEVLPDYLVKTLHHELQMNNIHLLDNDETVDLVNMSYSKIKWTPQFIQDETQKLQYDLKGYQQLKQLIRSLQGHNDIAIDRSIITDIEWLSAYVEYHREQYIQKYPERAQERAQERAEECSQECSQKSDIMCVNNEAVSESEIDTMDDDFEAELVRINETIDKDFAWISSYMQTQTGSPPSKKKIVDYDFSKANRAEIGHRYRCILRKLYAVNQCFNRLLKHTVDEDEYVAIKERDYQPKLHFDRPDVILDAFFYHLYTFHGEPISNAHTIWEKEYPKASKLISKFEYMTYCLINRTDEYMFELCQYPSNFEKRVHYALNYIALKDIKM